MKGEHINKLMLELYTSGYKYLSKDVLKQIREHLPSCTLCRKRFEEALQETASWEVSEKSAEAVVQRLEIGTKSGQADKTAVGDKLQDQKSESSEEVDKAAKQKQSRLHLAEKRLRQAVEGLMDEDPECRRRAIEPFVQATFESLIKLLYRYLGNEVECEEVLQDVYADIWENPDHLRNITNEKQLIETIYQKYMKKRLREVYRRRKLNLRLPEEGLLERVSEEELASLGVRERRALQLWMDGWSKRAIASELKTTVEAVKMLIYRSTQKLKKAIYAPYYED